MPTPDGISTEDWDVVHTLAVEIFNASNDQQDVDLRRRLFDWLDKLEAKYGPLPSSLATRSIPDHHQQNGILVTFHSSHPSVGSQLGMTGQISRRHSASTICPTDHEMP